MEDIRTKRGVSDLEFKGIIDNFDEFNMISVNEELILLFESLHDFSFDELMYFEDPLHYENIGVQTIISQIDEIISVLFYNIDIKTTDDVISIVKSDILLFKRAMDQIDLKYFIFFSYLNSYLNVDVDYLINHFNYELNMIKMEEKINELFNQIQVFPKPNDNNLSPLLKNVLFKSLKKDDIMHSSLKLLNISKDPFIFYNFKIYCPKLLTSMLMLIKKINYDSFLRNMFDVNNLIMAVLFCKELDMSEILECYYENDISNIDLLFAFLKKIIDSNELIDDNIVFIKDILLDILELNENLFRKIIQLFKHKELFNRSIGLLLSEINKWEVELIVNEFDLNFGANNHLINLRENILINLDKKSDNFKLVLKLVYKNWDLNLNSLLDDDENGWDLLCSDFNSFILEYYNQFYDDDMLVEEMKLNFNFLEKINSIWSSNFTNYKNRIHVYYTKLYLLSSIYKKRNINNLEILGCYENFFKNKYLIEVLLRDKAKKSIIDFKKDYNMMKIQ